MTGLHVAPLSLQTVPGIVSNLSTVKACIVTVPRSLGHSSLWSLLPPIPLISSSLPIGWGTAPRQVHGDRCVVHGRWGICGVVLMSSSSSLSSRWASPVVLWKGALLIVIHSLIDIASSLGTSTSLL